MYASLSRAVREEPKGWVADTAGLAAVCVMVISALFVPGML
ncbi:hypothetical protein [Algicella marina]|nr:hypothetical protein [Algicella marina]